MKRKKTLTKLLALLMTLCLLLSSMSSFAFAEINEEDAKTPIYTSVLGSDNGAALRWSDSTGKYISKNKINFYWVYSWPNNKELARVGNDPLVTCGIFKLYDTESLEKNPDEAISYPAYCCDFIFSAIADKKYKRVNLEECTYFANETDAAKIRGIFEHGYWPISDVSDDAYLDTVCTAANKWLEEEQKSLTDDTPEPMNPDSIKDCTKIDRSSLTRDHAITATQLAIWTVANEAGYWGVDYKYIVPETDVTSATDVNNIRVLWAYFNSQKAKDPNEEILNDSNFLKETAVFTKANEDSSFDVIVKFKSEHDVEAKDDITFKATLKEEGEDGNTVTAALHSSEMTKDEKGYYTITLKGVKKDGTVTLSADGKQNVSDVYFYEAQPEKRETARSTSQNMVGLYEGLTPVNAEMKTPVSYTLGIEDASITIYDPTTETDKESGVEVDGKFYLPIEGVELDLYAKDPSNEDSDFILVKEGLVSDEDGKVEVEGLNEGYDYFFKITDAPLGYDPGSSDFIKGDGNSNIAISKIPYIDIVTNINWENDREQDRPASFKVQLMKDGKAEGEPVEFTKENDWTYTWKDLDNRNEYTIEPIKQDRYESEIIPRDNGFVVNNTYVPEYKDIPVKINWKNDKKDDRPEKVLIQLLKDGDPEGDPVELNEENSWSHTFEKLDDRYTWDIQPKDSPSGYEMTISESENEISITYNYMNDAAATPLPPEEGTDIRETQTGDDSSILITVAIAAIALLVMSWLLFTRRQETKK